MAPDESPPDKVWFIKVKYSFESADMMDDYKNVIAPGLCSIEGGFMGKVDVLAKGFLYKLRKKHFF